MFSDILPSKNASSRTATHHAELVRMKNADVAPALVSTQSWDVHHSFPLQHHHHHRQQLTKALLLALVLIAPKLWFQSLPQTLPQLSVQYFAPLTRGFCLHCHGWFPPWPLTFVSTRCRMKWLAQLALFVWGHDSYHSLSALPAAPWVQCFLLLAAWRVQAVMSSSEPLPQGYSQEPDLSCFQLTLISKLLKISVWGLRASKFNLLVLGLLLFFAFCGPLNA